MNKNSEPKQLTEKEFNDNYKAQRKELKEEMKLRKKELKKPYEIIFNYYSPSNPKHKMVFFDGAGTEFEQKGFYHGLGDIISIGVRRGRITDYVCIPTVAIDKFIKDLQKCYTKNNN